LRETDFESERGYAEDARGPISARIEHVDEHWERGGPTVAHALGQPPDLVEAALAEALRRAAEAGAFDAVAALTGELRAQREARARTLSLEAERAKRGGGGPEFGVLLGRGG
jgi:hypothetical protein